MKVETEMGNMMSIVGMLFRWFLIFHFLFRGFFFIVKNRLLAFFLACDEGEIRSPEICGAKLSEIELCWKIN